MPYIMLSGWEPTTNATFTRTGGATMRLNVKIPGTPMQCSCYQGANRNLAYNPERSLELEVGGTPTICGCGPYSGPGGVPIPQWPATSKRYLDDPAFRQQVQDICEAEAGIAPTGNTPATIADNDTSRWANIIVAVTGVLILGGAVAYYAARKRGIKSLRGGSLKRVSRMRKNRSCKRRGR